MSCQTQKAEFHRKEQLLVYSLLFGGLHFYSNGPSVTTLRKPTPSKHSHSVIQVSDLSISVTDFELLFVVLLRQTVFTMALGLCQMAGFQSSYVLYLSGISNVKVFNIKCVRNDLRRKGNHSNGRKCVS